jgi:hypothetical protein
LDIGSVYTRAAFFDIVEGKYRLIGAGVAQSTAHNLSQDAWQGVKNALSQLQANTDRVLVTPEADLALFFSGEDNAGFPAITISGGPLLSVILVGLQEDISLKSLKTLSESLTVSAIETIHLNDGRKPGERTGLVLRTCPDLILIAGGTDYGASQALLNLLESVSVACSLLPAEARPAVLYAGNSAIRAKVQLLFQSVSQYYVTENIRPTLSEEKLGPAIDIAAHLSASIQLRKIAGGEVLSRAATTSTREATLLTAQAAFGRMIRFLSGVHPKETNHSLEKGVIGLDIGASAATIAVGIQGNLNLGVYPDLGLTRGLHGLLTAMPAEKLLRWLTMPIPESLVQEYLLNRSLFPGNLPSTAEETSIEQAVARLAIRLAAERISHHLPQIYRLEGSIFGFEPIVARGSVLTCSSSFEESMLILLDGLQPFGITTIILDQHHLLSSLGAIASINPTLAIQVLETNAFLHLGTVISPVGRAKPGTPILRLKMTRENGKEENFEILQGTLFRLPLLYGQPARLYLQPLQRFDVGMGGPGIGGTLRVVGGELGVLIDSRGRPFLPPLDPFQGQELFHQWLSILKMSNEPGKNVQV